MAAQRATCCKRAVGAAIFNVNRQIVSTGYNGPPAKMPHCIDQPCRASLLSAPASHIGCAAVHAEANAIIQAGPAARSGFLAITTSPCYQCAALIVNAGISTLIIGEINKLWNDNINYHVSPKHLLYTTDIKIIYRGL